MYVCLRQAVSSGRAARRESTSFRALRALKRCWCTFPAQLQFFADRQAKVCASDLGRNEFAVESRASSSISTASNPPKLEPNEKRSCRNHFSKKPETETSL